jgi:hypothetical protein
MILTCILVTRQQRTVCAFCAYILASDKLQLLIYFYDIYAVFQKVYVIGIDQKLTCPIEL